MLAEDRVHGHSQRFGTKDRRPEDGRLGDLEPHVEPEEHEHGTGQKGQPPAESEELRLGQAAREQQKRSAREQKAEGRAELREHAVEGAFVRWGVLDGEQHRPTPLASQSDALAEPAPGEQHRRGEAQRAVARQRADGKGGQTHAQQRQNQRRLAPKTVAEMPEDHGTDRSREKGDTEGGQGGQRRGGGVRRREEQAWEHQHRRRGEDIEIEELDRGADQAGQEHLPRRVDRTLRSFCCRHRFDHLFPNIGGGNFAWQEPVRAARR